MFFIISKLLGFLVSPLSWVVIIMIIGLLIKDQRKKQKIWAYSFFILYFFSNSFILDEFARKWEIPAIEIASSDNFDGIIVLGGISAYDHKLKRIQFLKSNDRLMQGLLLYKQNTSRKLIFTGGSGSILHPEDTEGIFVGKFLQEIDVPAKHLIIESDSRNTYENALFTKEKIKNILPEKGKFLLVTSAFHMRRSIGLFRKAGFDVVPYSTDRMSGPRKYEFDHLIIPNLGAMGGWNALFHEFVGYGVYWVRGYL